MELRSVTSKTASSDWMQFVRADDAEVARLGVEPHHITDETTLHACAFGGCDARLIYFDSVIVKIGQAQIYEQEPAIGMRICAHTPLALRVPVPPARRSTCRRCQTIPPPCSSSSMTQEILRCSGLAAKSPTGTWCAR